jgi:hypothetical protein
MADKKISALTGAATPLAGTEVLPIVQSGSTVKVAVSDLTAGRSVNGSGFIASGSFGAGGTTPTAGWNTAVFQTQNASFNSNNGQDLRLYQNIYYDGSNYRYITANPGGFMLQYQNETEWYRSTDGSPAAGGVANATSVVKFTTTGNVNVSNGNVVMGTTAKGITTGSAIPLGFGVNNSVTAITIDTLSNVGVGTTTPVDYSAFGYGPTLEARGARGGSFVTSNSDATVRAVFAVDSANSILSIKTVTNHSVAFGVNDTEYMRLSTNGNLGLGTTAPAATAILDAQSTTKGVRFPNMTTTQKNAITPSAGTVVFDTTLAKLCVYSGSAWQTITSI